MQDPSLVEWPATELADWLKRLGEGARQESDRLAVRASSGALSWSDLERQIQALCAQLAQAGVGRESRVAVFLDREPTAVVAFLAILRLGGVYLPLDPSTPADRLDRIFEQVGRLWVVTSPDLEGNLPRSELATVIRGRGGELPQTEAFETVERAPDDLPAYIMFTSGSTGSPQGVVVSRRALARYVATLESILGVEVSDVYLHSASFSFSASIRQLVAPLAAGATLALAGEADRHDPIVLLERMRSWGVTIWDTVPSVWRVTERVIAGLEGRDDRVDVPPSLRLIQLTGEPLGWDLVRAWRRRLDKGVEIRNLYSQTETAGTVAVHSVPEDCSGFEGTVPFGEPLPGVELLVLDQDLEPAAEGAAGEIFVASDRLADGYLVPDKSSSRKFLRDLRIGERSYRQICRSGDVARRDSRGWLVPAGRRDLRVKIRGFRVDLSEVQTALEKDESVGQAVVTAEAAAGEGGQQLVAYVLAASETSSDVEAIRQRLSAMLPDYAVPGWIELVTDIPTTASGKIDRKALTEWRRRRSPQSAETPADDEQVAALLAIWERVLGYEGARLDDDFFTHGGDSLVAISLFVEIEQEFGIRLPPSTLFSAATVAALSDRIRTEDSAVASSSVLTLQEGGSLPPLFLIHTIWEHLPHFRELVKLLDPELPVLALEPTRDHRDLDRGTDVDGLIEGYARDIQSACPEGPYLLGGWSIGGLMAYGTAVVLEKAGHPPAQVLLIDSASPALRPQLRRAGGWKGPGWLSHAWLLLKRQVKSFGLSPGEQRERLRWAVRETRRRIREWIRSPPGLEVRERLKQEFRVIVDQFRPLPYRGAVTLFRSEQRALDPALEEDLGWNQWVEGELDIVRLPGDHVSVVIEPRNMRLLAAGLTETVEQIAGREPQRRAEEATDPEVAIDRFLEGSKGLVGKPFTERQPWNNVATRDAIRQFAFGICDENPLWTDPDYAASSAFGRLVAPPTFLVSARYPILHGAPVDAPLLSLLKEIEYTWEKRLFVDDALESTTEQGEVREVVEPGGNRRIYVDSHTFYRNGSGEVVGRARGTVVRMPSQGEFEVEEWSPHPYRDDELESIQQEMLAETRTGGRRLSAAEAEVGARLPAIVRGPLNIGDMVCWHAAVGPSYRPGPLGLQDIRATPQFRVVHPTTGWPIKYMLQHEDLNLARQRGMPAPFDNGVMRFAWVSPLLTNWMGDLGFLARLRVTIHLPVLYGDTCWYTGEVTDRKVEDTHTRVGIRILGTKQNGSIATSGSAEVLLPGDSTAASIVGFA